MSHAKSELDLLRILAGELSEVSTRRITHDEPKDGTDIDFHPQEVDDLKDELKKAKEQVEAVKTRLSGGE